MIQTAVLSVNSLRIFPIARSDCNSLVINARDLIVATKASDGDTAILADLAVLGDFTIIQGSVEPVHDSEVFSFGCSMAGDKDTSSLTVQT
jgi:hypothetical protein